MQSRKMAGLALAVCVCAGIAYLETRHANEGMLPAPLSRLQERSTPAGPVGLQVPANATLDTPQPFALDAATARRAVREGKLDVALPDGTRYPVRIERQFTDESGHWNVVGRVDTAFGAQPMVMTFGANSVFGFLPKPDGQALRVITQPGHRIAMAPAGGIVPRDLPPPKLLDDEVQSPQAPAPKLTLVARASYKRASTAASASQMERVAHPQEDDGALASASAAPVDTTPVDITVLVAYTPEQVALRGSVDAVQTEIASLIATANQAHIDSGSRVRFSQEAALQYTTPLSQAFVALSNIANDRTLDDVRGDLVVLLRPRLANDACGAAFTGGANHARNQLLSYEAYAVVSVNGDCSPLVFAHETGHLFGAMHDRASETKLNGAIMQGAYKFSYAQRTQAFSTIMSGYQTPWVPYFSNPQSMACGARCGVGEYADNVRTFNLNAPAVALFGGPAGQIVIPDAEGLEPSQSILDATGRLQIRLYGKAPPGGIALHVEPIGGTATLYDDYFPSTQDIVIPEGASSVSYSFRILTDSAADEGDETIQWRVTAPNGDAQILRDTATFTIVEPQRHALTGRLVFPSWSGEHSDIQMKVSGFDEGAGFAYQTTYTLSPPDYAFSMVVPDGAQVRFDPTLPDSWILTSGKPYSPEVREDTYVPQPVDWGVRISGHLTPKAGFVLPNAPAALTVVYGDGQSQPMVSYLTVQPPDFAYSKLFVPGQDVSISASPGAPFLPYNVDFFDLKQDIVHDIVLGDVPTLRVREDARRGDVSPPWAYLDSPAPAGGVRFRCRTVDRTARAGVDYTPINTIVTIPAGQWGFAGCGDQLQYVFDRNFTVSFDVVIDQVTGANATTPVATVRILGKPLHTGGPSQRAAK